MNATIIRRRSLLALTSVLLYTAMVAAASMLTRAIGGVAALWPANATVLALVVVLAHDRGDRAALAAGMAVATVLASVQRGYPLLFSAVFPIANVGEVLLAAAMLRRAGAGSAPFSRVSGVVALVLASFVAPLVSASLGAAAILAKGGGEPGRQWAVWYLCDALSIAITTPLLTVMLQLAMRLLRRAVPPREMAELLLLVVIVPVASGLVFLFGTQPALWALPPLLLVATFRLRETGATIAVALTALVASIATAHGLGPIVAISREPAVQVVLLQFFGAMLFVLALPVAAALAERDAREREAKLLAAQYRAVVDNVDEVIFRTDRDGRWTYLNPAWSALSGFAVAPSLGRHWLERVDDAEQVELGAWAAPVFAGEVRATRRLLRFRTAGGERRWMELSIQALHAGDGAVLGATGMMRDVHDRKRLEEHVLAAKRQAEKRAREAAVLAATDELTGLANRRAFLHDLARQVAAAGEFAWPLSLAIFDIDHFKTVNDRHGHLVGDRVLCRTADRARAVVRGGDLVGRIGGEEFAILMPGAAPADAALVAERLRDAVQRPSRGHEPDPLPRVTVSVGIALLQPGDDAEALLAAADAALYEAKAAGRNRVEVAD